MRKLRKIKQHDEQEDRPLTRLEVESYRANVKVSLAAAQRGLKRQDALALRPVRQKKLTLKQKTRDLRRRAALQEHITKLSQLIERIDLELSK